MKEEEYSNRGQMVVWVIIALFLVFGVIIFFLFSGKRVINIPVTDTDPAIFIQQCMKNSITTSADSMISQGGFLHPKYAALWGNTPIAYLCYTDDFFSPCIHQHPLLNEEIRDALAIYVKEKSELCFLELEEDLREKEYTVTLDREPTTNVTLMQGTISANIARPMTISKNSVVKQISNFQISVPHPIYDLSIAALDIINDESMYCEFDYVAYSLAYPILDISKESLIDEGGVVYHIRHLPTGKIFNFAIRGCVLPTS